jgi:hypothetical protein
VRLTVVIHEHQGAVEILGVMTVAVELYIPSGLTSIHVSMKWITSGNCATHRVAWRKPLREPR